jgi:hypothetical protein
MQIEKESFTDENCAKGWNDDGEARCLIEWTLKYIWKIETPDLIEKSQMINLENEIIHWDTSK